MASKYISSDQAGIRRTRPVPRGGERKEMGQVQAKEKEERGNRQTTKCSGRPSLSKGGTHRATGPVIIKKVGSTAFSATSRGSGDGGSCVATA